MKFKFCGNIDCPEWLISEIIYINKINAVKLRIISNNITEGLISGNMSFTKSYKLLEEMSFNEKEINIIIAIIIFIFNSSIKFEIDPSILNQELQYLGIPQENIESIIKAYKSNYTSLKDIAYNKIFTHPTIHKFDWKLDYILSDNLNSFKLENFQKLKEEEETGITQPTQSIEKQITIKINEDLFVLSKDKLGLLINDLDKACSIIKNYN